MQLKVSRKDNRKHDEHRVARAFWVRALRAGAARRLQVRALAGPGVLSEAPRHAGSADGRIDRSMHNSQCSMANDLVVNCELWIVH